MKKTHLTPTTLRLILSTGLILAIAAAVIVFVFASGRLGEVATTVSHKVSDAKASQNSLANLKKIEEFIADHQETVTRANEIVAESKSYEYQDQIIYDLKTYAENADITITNFDFAAGNSSTTTAAPVAGAAAPAAGTPAPTETAAPAASGVKSTSVSISVESPVRYENILRFIKAVEQNLTKMQVSAVSLAKGTGKDEVGTDTLTIEVYIR